MILIKTSLGDIKLELHEKEAPKTVENFLEYVRSGFYDNTIFHRVINGFMIQGGGLTDDMQTKKTNTPITNEAKGAKPNKRGTVAMARTMEPHSATAQFFINIQDNGFLDFADESVEKYGYCVFGEVTEGMDIVDKIAKVKTTSKMGHGDVPVEEVYIESVKEV